MLVEHGLVVKLRLATRLRASSATSTTLTDRRAPAPIARAGRLRERDEKGTLCPVGARLGAREPLRETV